MGYLSGTVLSHFQITLAAPNGACETNYLPTGTSDIGITCATILTDVAVLDRQTWVLL
jgi:hypothetical protein